MVMDEPYETECGYYDNMVLVHEGLNCRVELSEDPQLGITVQMYIGCADGHPDLVARPMPSMWHGLLRRQSPICSLQRMLLLC